MKTKLPKLVINLSFGLLVGFSLLFLPASLALAADAIKFTPQVAIPGFATGAVDVGTTVDGKMTSDLLARYIKAMYDYGLKAAGILAAVILMGGGLIWLTSAGNESKIGQAKEMIVGAISGLIILFSAWLILNTVNPALLSLTPMSLTKLTVNADYLITNLENAPADMKYGWICMNSADQRCEDNIPPSINLDTSICRSGNPANQEPTDCLYNQKKCCGQSAIVTQTADNFCKGKGDYTPCTLNSTAVKKGYCYQEKCINTKVCCQCGQGEVAGVYVYVTCKNDILPDECASWCVNGWVGSSYKMYVPNSSYSCDGGAMSYCQQQ